MLQHYFHQSYQYRTKRRNIRQFKMCASRIKSQQNRQKFVCMSNGNAIQIYKLSSESVDFYLRKQFFCNIAKMQIIPSLHTDSDYIFILDDLGRYCFWRPGQEQKLTSNIIQKQTASKRYYRQQLSPEQQQQFSGCVFKYDVKDTVGHIFFTVQNKLTVLGISIKLKQGLRMLNNRTYEIPYTRFRYVNCLSIPNTKDNELFIGIIQQLQQKTILKIHLLNTQISSIVIDQQSLTYKVEKMNLLSFQSGESDQIIVLTYDEISIFKHKQSQYLCNYRTRGNYGAVCYVEPTLNRVNKSLSQATYIHLGFEMTVFTKNRLKNYGPLKLQGRSLLQGSGIVQSKYLGQLANGEVMIAFVTNFSEVYFVTLHENRWRLVRKVQSLSSIFSLHQLQSQQNIESMIAVHSSLQNQSQITHLQVISPTVIWLEQAIQDKVIQTVQAVQGGQSLIVCTGEQNSLLGWSQVHKRWVDRLQFTNNREKVLACTELYVVMTSGIYMYQAEKGSELKMTQLLKEQNILSATTNNHCIGYYTSQGNFKFYEFESQSVARIRKNCTEEYMWHMLPEADILVTAAYNQLGQFGIVPIHKPARQITLQTKQLVSSISSISYSPPPSHRQNRMIDESTQQAIHTDLVMGFHNGDVEVYSLERNKTVAKFNVGSQMVSISPYRSKHLIVYTARKQFILSKCTPSHSVKSSHQQGSTLPCTQHEEQYTLHQIQLSDSSQTNLIHRVLYLSKFDKFLVLFYNSAQSANNQSQIRQTSTVLQLRSLKLNKKLSDNQLTLQLKSSISMKTIFRTQSGEDIPFVEVANGEYVYIALPEVILKYSIRNKQLVKKQLHLLKQITGIEQTMTGILVAGVDVMQCGSVVLFDSVDLSIKGTYNLATNKPTCIRALKSERFSNRFFIRYQHYLALLQIQPTFIITHIKTINTKTTGCTMDINERYNKLLLTDPNQYLSVWDYDLQISSYDILPVSKYFGGHMINDCCWIDGAVVTGDRGGKLSIMQFNLGNPNDLHKMSMTKVAQIYVGQQVFTLRKVQLEQQFTQSMDESKHQTRERSTTEPQLAKPSCVYYGTSNGSIGVIKTISQKQFKLLKQIQHDTVQYMDKKDHFSYQQWRGRIPKCDKLVDSAVIKCYLDEFRFRVNVSQEDFYNQVNEVYDRLIGGIKYKKMSKQIIL